MLNGSLVTLSVLDPIVLDDYHTFTLPQTATQLIIVDALDELPLLRQRLDCQPYWLGEGANTIFVEPIKRPIVKLSANQVVLSAQDDAVYCHAEAGKDWHQLVVELAEQGVGGLENLALIPGSVGAAPVQNIGAYGVELADFCDYVDVFDWRSGESRRLTAADCQFDYRHSIFKTPQAASWLITAVGFQLPRNWQPKLTYQGLDELAVNDGLTPLNVVQRVTEIREQKLPDPKKIGNAGSFFKNPTLPSAQAKALQAQYPAMPSFDVAGGIKIPAAWLIDQLGWKGKGVGGAYVHHHQALVLTNRGHATAEDVINLARQIKQQVLAEYGIELTPEVRFLGAQAELTLEQAYAKTCL
ncbi:UDP-N-acetylmuramate dehydrogenase [Neiella marina]|uniref:UDP-N-acetylenolpyruvoylglucosamine reductase n=1 Tax=Neiella holothuriorum TaxID=2870530 RepID=A0ABS7EH35_9GAMM|nr:UDP-N-acetylmuramate dehydrogenase [Neiella holothuriorum]MBW8191657.1 UDP-N-acetylmuramate dehydrogenase [Neiella holothuriorum]